MQSRKLHLDGLRVESFDLGGSPIDGARLLLATDPVTSDPSTYEDTCIKMCPTDDTCTMLGCTRTGALAV